MNRWQVGNVRVTQVVEIGPVPTSPKFFFKDPPADLVARHGGSSRTSPTSRIDCCCRSTASSSSLRPAHRGRHLRRQRQEAQHPAWNQLNGSFLQDLTEAGFAPESIDTVLCTHLHVDHVGWNTRLVDGHWVPTFQNARYLFARKEWEHWSLVAKSRSQSGYGNGEPDDVVLGDSVRPIIDAGLAELVDTDHRLTEEVWLEPTPGHTPGHVSVRIESDGQWAVITGDLMHHPIQCSEPDRIVNFDHDRELARSTRRHFLACCARDRTLVFGTHFAPPTAGHVVAAGETWRFDVD